MRLFFSLPVLSLLAFFVAYPVYAASDSKEKIQHIIVLYLENHSFDNLFGNFPDAEGRAYAKKTSVQTDRGGIAYQALPPIRDKNQSPPAIDARFPLDLANRPFPIEDYASIDDKTVDLTHLFYQEQEQINGGKMDRFAAISSAGGLTMGYYDGSQLQLWKYAQKYTLADHFFHAAFGSSFLNHFWLVCACTPRFDHAPKSVIIHKNDTGEWSADGSVTEDGYAVNFVLSSQSPHPSGMDDSPQLLPPQTMPTIGDRLSDKGISWAWYAGGWNNAIAGKADDSFQYHHHPFIYFKAFDDGSNARKNHLKDEQDFLDALKNDTLPAVSFYKPLGKYNMHPGYADVTSGDDRAIMILQAIEHSKAWKNSVVIVTFDENGGYWDHVPPPKIDRWGPGVRVPTIIISPFAKKHFVDHTVYDTTSILKFIEWRFDLEALGTRDASANNLLHTLNLH